MAVLENRLKSEVIVVPGGSGDIGSDIVAEFLKLGLKVAVPTSNNAYAQGGVPENLSDLVAKFPDNLYVAYCEYEDPEQVKEFVSQVHKEYGKVDSLIYAAGKFPSPGNLEDKGIDAIRVMEKEIKGFVNFYSASIEDMRDIGFGRIITFGSTAMEQNNPHFSVYIAYKNAIFSLIKAISLDNKKHNITANMISPGYVDTESVRSHMPKLSSDQKVPIQRVTGIVKKCCL
ncbi:MAG: SDR family NAD(P)-dependent oxidoreductase, partial [Nanoarchaeota archaeon]|nr:SDR family NAD(P)-dependent oxidoreductase [Nanoarchaeota archaeon]